MGKNLAFKNPPSLKFHNRTDINVHIIDGRFLKRIDHGSSLIVLLGLLTQALASNLVGVKFSDMMESESERSRRMPNG